MGGNSTDGLIGLKEGCLNSKVYRTLFVDDDAVCRKATKDLLEDLSCKVDVATTAQQAIGLLKNQYDIIFMDIGLPDKDGIALAREIKEVLNIDTPIVAITASAWNIRVYNEVGIVGLIRKPLTRKKMAYALVRFSQ